eukprot:1221302-Amphidinium_carterae.1
MEQTAAEEEAIRVAEPGTAELKTLSAISAIPYPIVRTMLLSDEPLCMFESSGLCLDLRGNPEIEHECGRKAILAAIQTTTPKLVVVPYLANTQQEFVGSVAGLQSSLGNLCAVCMLDDVQLRVENIPLPHKSQLFGSCVLHNLNIGEGSRACVLSAEACAIAKSIECLLELEMLPVNVGRKNLQSRDTPPDLEVHSMIFGAYTSYGLGVSKNGVQRRELLALLHSLASERPEQAEPYSTINVHTRNRPGKSWLVSFGPYEGQGGRLWVESPSGPHPPPNGVVIPSDAPPNIKGIYLDPYRQWVAFDASVWHAVESVSRTRCRYAAGKMRGGGG